jgi:hypothetical protein
MARLILNDIRLNAFGLLVIFVLFNLFLDFLSAHTMLHYRRTAGAGAGLFFASVMVLYVFLREELNKGQIIYRSLPLSHVKIVTARYVSISLIALACIVYGLLFQQVILRFSAAHASWWPLTHQMDPGYAFEHSLIARGMAISLIMGFAIPLMMRFTIPITGIVAGYLAALFIWSRLVDHLMDYSLHTSFFLGLSRWSSFAVVLMIVINVIAFKLSIWLYGQKQL